MTTDYNSIAQKIEEGQIDEALQQLKKTLQDYPLDARLLYLMGQAHMKRSEWGKAIGCFRQSKQIDGNSAAAQAEEMLNGIMDFYNKDMYNQ